MPFHGGTRLNLIMPPPPPVIPPAGISLVQHKSVQVNGGNATISGLAGTIASNVMLVFMSFFDPGNTCTSLTDNAGGGSSTYTQIPGVYTNLSDGGFSAIDAFLCINLNAGATSITAVGSGSGLYGLFALEVSGLITKAVDVKNNAYNTSNNAVLSGPSITTTVANEFLAGFAVGQGTAMQGLDSSDTVFTVADLETPKHGCSAYSIVSSTGTYAPIWKQSSAAELGMITLGLK